MERKNNISICVRSLSTYAEADWITPAEALDFMKMQKSKDGSEEFIIVDYDAPFSIGEYDSVSELAEIAEKLENLDDSEIEVLEIIMENYTSNFEKALEKVEDGDYMIYSDCWSMAEVAERYLDETGMLNELPDFAVRYFDFQSYGRDMEIEGYFYPLINSVGYVEIF